MYEAIFRAMIEGIFNDYYLNIIITTGIFIILALSLNLINGFCGQFSLGHAGFWGVGAYCSAIYSVFYPLQVHYSLNLIIAILIGFLSSAICGLIIGASCLRLRGDYLAIATLGFGEIIRIVFMNTEKVGGPRGFSNIPQWANVYWVYGFVILTVIFMINLKKSAFGRAIISIREDEIAAENMGVNLFGYKLFSFSVGAGIAGIAGALYSHTQTFIEPNGFGFMVSVIILVMIILGGLGSVTGAIIGAIILMIFPEFLKYLGDIKGSEYWKEIPKFRMPIYAILLMVLMLFRPSGIFGSLEWGERKKMNKKASA
jgi:branched-chain amino acid transport system permease protein